jgi:multidrug efflux pump subunit AcrA (membrane-fusion protein)
LVTGLVAFFIAGAGICWGGDGTSPGAEADQAEAEQAAAEAEQAEAEAEQAEAEAGAGQVATEAERAAAEVEAAAEQAEAEAEAKAEQAEAEAEPASKAKTIGLLVWGGQYDFNADFAREGGNNDRVGSVFGQLRHERERFVGQVSYYKNLNYVTTGNDLDLVIVQPGIKFKPSSTTTLLPSLKFDATWLNRHENSFYQSYGINIDAKFDEQLLTNLNLDIAFRDFDSRDDTNGEDGVIVNFSGTLDKTDLLVEGASLTLKPYILSNLAYTISADAEPAGEKGKYLEAGANASYSVPVIERFSVEPKAGYSRRSYKILAGMNKDYHNVTYGLSASIDEFIFSNQTLTMSWDHEENFSSVDDDDYTNDAISMDILWLFF